MEKSAKKLSQEHVLDAEALCRLITSSCEDDTVYEQLRHEAVKTARSRFGYGIYVRGLIEVSSYCHNDCLYCGLRRSNTAAERYRLSDSEILECCEYGYRIGMRTFVLQGGEDSTFNDERLISLISSIKSRYADAAITLSLGERTEASYRVLFQTGASRYLLRHEAADYKLYRSMHPTHMSHENRIACIENLIKIGYQTGMGMIVGLPGQTVESLVKDLILMKKLNPQMIGIGPFIPHHQTPLSNHPTGDLRLALTILAIIRLMFPDALIPSTTALSSISPEGRIAGILSGANVVMPNLSPIGVRSKYSIYDNKLAFGAEAAETIEILERELKAIGYDIDYSIGDYKANKIWQTNTM